MANPVVMRRNFNVGHADAESDDLLLENCFVDSGDLALLVDCDNPKSLVLGRTGAGKTALLRQVERSVTNPITLQPEALALNYITNSGVLQFFEAAGVQLDTFYTLLWRHILAVELLKKKFQIYNERNQSEFLFSIKTLFSDNRAKERALAYLTQWGNKFWMETQYRTQEFTKKLENELEAEAGVEIADVAKIGVKGVAKLSEEQKGQVVEAGQRVVNNVQVKELGEVIDLLAHDIFNDKRERYYILIDRLDEDWVDDRIRFKLIRALLDAIKTFRKIKSVKIIACLRTDLHYRVLKSITSPGFQSEKYTALYHRIQWTRPQLMDLLDRRVNFQFKRQYSGAEVRLSDIMPPNQIGRRTTTEYMLDRTFFRPREAIIYLNECIERSEGATKISVSVIRSAEVKYSTDRLQALTEEWRREYPALRNTMRLLEKRNASFTINEFTRAEVEAFADKFVSDSQNAKDPLFPVLERFFCNDGSIDLVSCLQEVMQVLYKVGVVGVKSDPQMARQWSMFDDALLTSGHPKPDATIAVHKAFWSALNITPTTTADD